jgi:hypothetical protein
LLDCGGLGVGRTSVGTTLQHAFAAHEEQGKTVEVSWATVGDMDRRELMGREVDLIAAHRKCFGSPACQFHGKLDT